MVTVPTPTWEFNLQSATYSDVGTPVDTVGFLGGNTALTYDGTEYSTTGVEVISAGDLGNTMSAVFKIDAGVTSGAHGIMAQKDSGNANRMHSMSYDHTNGRILIEWADHRFHLRTANTGAGSIELDTWYHILTTVDDLNVSGSIKVYLNGVDVTTDELQVLGGFTGGGAFGSVTTLKVGTADFGSGLMDGIVDKPKLWNDIELTPEEALQEAIDEGFGPSVDTSKSNPMYPDGSMSPDGTLLADGSMNPDDALMKL